MNSLRVAILVVFALYALPLAIAAQTNSRAQPAERTYTRESCSTAHGTTDPIPAAYSDLFDQLTGDLSDFQTAVDAGWNGSTYPVAFAGQLTSANSNNGPGLLDPSGMQSIQQELQVLKAVGVQAVSVEVSFPMLYEPFLGSSYSQWVAFYDNVAAAVRAYGFKLIVESQSMMPSGLDSTSWGPQLQAFYPTLSFSQYVAARASTAAAVASAMRPDYFVLQEEPDTESHQSGQVNLQTVAGSTTMLSATVAAVAGSVPGMKIGAGFGSWLPTYQSFANSFTRTGCGAGQPCVSSPLDFLDMHLFPVIEHAIDCAPGVPCPPGVANFWQNAMSVVATAKTAGMHMTISQTWLRKVRDSEWLILYEGAGAEKAPVPASSSGGDIQEAREAYGFWAPLDQELLKILHDLANYQGMYFVAPFNTQNYSAYIQWSTSTAISGDCGSGPSPCGTLTPSQVFAEVQAAAKSAIPLAQYSSTGQYWHDLIVSDAIAPSEPANLSAAMTTSTTVTLSWTASTDNVGVAGYHVWRNGTQLPDTFAPPLQDTGLSAGTVYTYEVQAFDLSSNVSGKATTTVNGPVISTASFDGKKTVTIAGSNFGSGAHVLINSVDKYSRIKTATDTSITIKGKPSKLGLVSGSNSVQVVDSAGNGSNVYLFTYSP